MQCTYKSNVSDMRPHHYIIYSLNNKLVFKSQASQLVNLVDGENEVDSSNIKSVAKQIFRESKAIKHVKQDTLKYNCKIDKTDGKIITSAITIKFTMCTVSDRQDEVFHYHPS